MVCWNRILSEVLHHDLRKGETVETALRREGTLGKSKNIYEYSIGVSATVKQERILRPVS